MISIWLTRFLSRTYPLPSGWNATLLIGPKWPFTRPNSSSKTKWKKRASNLPILVDVVVTSIASCPPPITTWSNTQLEINHISKYLTPSPTQLSKQIYNISFSTYMWLERGHGSRVDGSVSLVRLLVSQSFHIEQLGCVVLGGCDEHHSVFWFLQVVNGFVVVADLAQQISWLKV